MKNPAALKREFSDRDAANKRMAILRSQLEALLDAGRYMAKSDSEDDVEHYLQRVYELYWHWDTEGMAVEKCWTAASVLNVPRRPEGHPLRILIDGTSGEPNEALQRRWTRALRYALYMAVEYHQLIEFFADNDGLKGCSRRFCRSDERKYNKAREERSRNSGPERVAAVLVFGSRLLG